MQCIDKFWIFLFFMMQVSLLLAQHMTGNFQSIQYKDGLTGLGNFSKQSLLEDDRGFIWISTGNGVSRYDGRAFKHYFHEPGNPNSLVSNSTSCISKDANGHIWIGTNNEGLSILDPVTDQITRYHEADHSGLCGNAINFIKSDHSGDIWIGTRFNGICKWEPELQKFSSIASEGSDGLSFLEDTKGNRWLGTAKGLQKFDSIQQRFSLIKIPNTPDRWQIVGFYEIDELPNGNLLLSTGYEGFWKFDPKSETFEDLIPYYTFQYGGAPEMVEIINNELWLSMFGEVWKCTLNEDLHTVANSAVKYFSDLPDYATQILQDRNENYWIMNYTTGIFYTSMLNPPFKLIGTHIIGESYYLNNNRLLFRTSENGAWEYDLNQKEWSRSTYPINRISAPGFTVSILNNQLFVSEGDADPGKIINLEDGSVRNIPPTKHSLFIANNKIWANIQYLDEDKLEWIDLHNTIRQNIPDFPDRLAYINSISDGAGSTLWIATRVGLFQFDERTSQGKVYKHDPNDPSSIIANNVEKIMPAKNDGFYIFTPNGVSKYLPETDRFRSLNLKINNRNIKVHSVIEDLNGNAWFASIDGLLKYDFKLDKPILYSNPHGIEAGINYQRFSSDKEGNIYFGATDQVYQFHPDSLNTLIQKGTIHITDFYVDHQNIPWGSPVYFQDSQDSLPKIRLNPDQRNLGFSFSMPTFYQPQQIQYFYRLKPFNLEWTNNGNLQNIHFTNLDYGNYLFEVKAINATESWSNNVARISLYIPPPWYLTAWAKLSLICLILGMLYAAYRYNLRRQYAKLENQRLAELDNLKTRLYTNITHEFRTPLTVILGMSDNIQQHEKEKSLIKRNAKNLLRLVNQLMDLAKLDTGKLKVNVINGDILSFIRYLTESFYSMASERNINLQLISKEETIIMDYDEVKIQHIFYNLISNAIKYTEPGGKVFIEVSRNDQNLQIKIKDTGIGIPETELPYIFDRFYQVNGDHLNSGKKKHIIQGTGIGLSVTKELIELMKGQIQVQSIVDWGTEFTIYLPIHNSKQPEPGKIYQDTPVQVISNAHLLKPQDNPKPDHVIGNVPQILLIEDNSGVVEYIKSILTPQYFLVTAINGQEGIEMAYEYIPDIIITDIMMPIMDGFDVCQELKQDYRTSHIPIIMLTAKADISSKIKGIEHGADAYLVKPFDKSELIIRIRKLLELRKKLQAYYHNINILDKPSEVSKPQHEFVQKVIQEIESHLSDAQYSVSDLANALHLSQTQIYRKLKAITGQTPVQLIRSIRLEKAKFLIKTTNLNISEIAYEVGFSDPNYFTRVFKKEFGHPPGYFKT